MVEGFLLTRHFRDAPGGLEVGFWAAHADGPLYLHFDALEAVCFIERAERLRTPGGPTLPDGVRRTPRELRTLAGVPVDALYSRRWRDLATLREQHVPGLHESDVKPHDRHLMERFVRAGVAAEGPIVQRDGYRLLRNPALKPAEVRPALRMLALDIETRGSTRELYSIAGAVAGGESRVYMIGPGTSQPRGGYTLHYGADERAVLAGFLGWLRDVDPDVLTGWSVTNFDLSFLCIKCQALGVPFAIGRGPERATVLQPGSRGGPRIARIPGRAVLDGIDVLKAGFWLFDSYSLDNVAHELLGTGKLIGSEQDKLAEINRLFRDDKPALADYNITDCTLVNDIFAHARLLEFAIARANLTGLALDRLAGAAAAFDNLYLPRLHRAGFVAPDIDRVTEAATSPGGHVMDSVPGLYTNVLVLDFKSLYPSIIRTFFVDPLALAVADQDTDPVPGFLDARFSRHRHILPGLTESLWHARDAARAAGDAPLATAIKIIMNSFYGVLGTNACRFFDPRLASSITRRGHRIILGTREVVEGAGYRVIYGDTDSLFVLVGDEVDGARADAIGAELVTLIDRHWRDTLRAEHDIRSRLEVQFETRYTRFLMPTVRGMPTGSKKRYAGLAVQPDGGTRLVVKGLEAARTDWTPLARRFQRELFRRVFHDEPIEAWVLATRDALLAGELDDELVYRKRLRREVSDYQRNVPPHVQAARELSRRGGRPGRWIRYVITRNGPEPVERLASPLDYEHYVERQLAPAADGILPFIGTSFGAITDAQLGLF